MMDDASIDAGAGAAAGAYRGFLFSDLRGFTAFGERYGNIAAAAKVSRFLDIARRAIGRHEGAEIKTEGDAIHAVFQSASGAVLCGLEIQDAAIELNAEDPDHAISMGVGVHAGEAVETAEGYIGRAVNIAARLCAAAKPGEVLVSSTVKGITQASIPVGFIPRGRRRLKGIQDPILVYAVTRDMTASERRVVPRSLVLGGAGVGFVIVAVIAMLLGSQFLKQAATPSASSAATFAAAQLVAIGPLPIGTYKSVVFEPEVTFDIVDPNWSANSNAADTLGLVHESAPVGNLEFLRVDEVIESPCGEGQGGQTGPGAADMLTKLQTLTHLTVSDPTTVRIGGFVGRQADISVSDGALAACGGLAGGGVSIFSVGGAVWNAASGERFTLIAVDVNGQAVTILLSADWTVTPSVQELEHLLELGQRILDRVRF